MTKFNGGDKIVYQVRGTLYSARVHAVRTNGNITIEVRFPLDDNKREIGIYQGIFITISSDGVSRYLRAAA